MHGLVWFQKNDYDKALADYNETIALDPKNAYAYSCRAQVWEKKLDREKQLADLTMAIQIKPRDLAYRVGRAYYLSARGMHAEAIADYDEAVRMAPGEPSTYLGRGFEWFKDQESDKAIADFTKAIQLDPKFANAYRAAPSPGKPKKNTKRRIKDFADVVLIQPDDFDAHKDIARFLATCRSEKVRDGRRAVAEATRACELTKWKNAFCLDTLAAAYAEAGDFPAAVKWETEAIKLHPDPIQRDMERGLGFKGRLDFYNNGRAVREE